MRRSLGWLVVVGVAVAGCATTSFGNLPEPDRTATCRAIAAGLEWGEVVRCSSQGIVGASPTPDLGLRAIRLDFDVRFSEGGRVRSVQMVQSPQQVGPHGAIAHCLSHYLYNRKIENYTAAKSTVVPVTFTFSPQLTASGVVHYAATSRGCTLEYVAGKTQ